MRAVVVAAGNEANARRHYLGNLAPLQEYEDVEISVGDNIGGFTAELLTNSPEVVSVAVQSPTGESQPLIPARQGSSEEYRFLLEGTTVSISYSLGEFTRERELIFCGLRIRARESGDCGYTRKIM